MKNFLRKFALALAASALAVSAAFAEPPPATPPADVAPGKEEAKPTTLTEDLLKERLAAAIKQREEICQTSGIFYDPGKVDKVEEAIRIYRGFLIDKTMNPLPIDRNQPAAAQKRTQDLLNAMWYYDTSEFHHNVAALYSEMQRKHFIRRAQQMRAAIKWYDDKSEEILQTLRNIADSLNAAKAAVNAVRSKRAPAGMIDTYGSPSHSLWPWAVSGREMLEITGLRKWFRRDGSLTANARDIGDLDRKNQTMSEAYVKMINDDFKELAELFNKTVLMGRAVRAGTAQFPAAKDIGALLDADAVLLEKAKNILAEGADATDTLLAEDTPIGKLRSGTYPYPPPSNTQNVANLRKHFREMVIERWERSARYVIDAYADLWPATTDREAMYKHMTTWE